MILRGLFGWKCFKVAHNQCGAKQTVGEGCLPPMCSRFPDSQNMGQDRSLPLPTMLKTESIIFRTGQLSWQQDEFLMHLSDNQTSRSSSADKSGRSAVLSVSEVTTGLVRSEIILESSPADLQAYRRVASQEVMVLYHPINGSAWVYNMQGQLIDKASKPRPSKIVATCRPKLQNGLFLFACEDDSLYALLVRKARPNANTASPSNSKQTVISPPIRLEKACKVVKMTAHPVLPVVFIQPSMGPVVVVSYEQLYRQLLVDMASGKGLPAPKTALILLSGEVMEEEDEAEEDQPAASAPSTAHGAPKKTKAVYTLPQVASLTFPTDAPSGVVPAVSHLSVHPKGSEVAVIYGHALVLTYPLTALHGTGASVPIAHNASFPLPVSDCEHSFQLVCYTGAVLTVIMARRRVSEKAPGFLSALHGKGVPLAYHPLPPIALALQVPGLQLLATQELGLPPLCGKSSSLNYNPVTMGYTSGRLVLTFRAVYSDKSNHQGSLHMVYAHSSQFFQSRGLAVFGHALHNTIPLPLEGYLYGLHAINSNFALKGKTWSDLAYTELVGAAQGAVGASAAVGLPKAFVLTANAPCSAYDLQSVDYTPTGNAEHYQPLVKHLLSLPMQLSDALCREAIKQSYGWCKLNKEDYILQDGLFFPLSISALDGMVMVRGLLQGGEQVHGEVAVCKPCVVLVKEHYVHLSFRDIAGNIALSGDGKTLHVLSNDGALKHASSVALDMVADRLHAVGDRLLLVAEDKLHLGKLSIGWEEHGCYSLEQGECLLDVINQPSSKHALLSSLAPGYLALLTDKRVVILKDMVPVNVLCYGTAHDSTQKVTSNPSSKFKAAIQAALAKTGSAAEQKADKTLDTIKQIQWVGNALLLVTDTALKYMLPGKLASDLTLSRALGTSSNTICCLPVNKTMTLLLALSDRALFVQAGRVVVRPINLLEPLLLGLLAAGNKDKDLLLHVLAVHRESKIGAQYSRTLLKALLAYDLPGPSSSGGSSGGGGQVGNLLVYLMLQGERTDFPLHRLQSVPMYNQHQLGNPTALLALVSNKTLQDILQGHETFGGAAMPLVGSALYDKLLAATKLLPQDGFVWKVLDMLGAHDLLLEAAAAAKAEGFDGYLQELLANQSALQDKDLAALAKHVPVPKQGVLLTNATHANRTKSLSHALSAAYTTPAFPAPISLDPRVVNNTAYNLHPLSCDLLEDFLVSSKVETFSVAVASTAEAVSFFPDHPLPKHWLEGIGTGREMDKVVLYCRFSDEGRYCNSAQPASICSFLNLSKYEQPSLELYGSTEAFSVGYTSSNIDPGDKHEAVKGLNDLVHASGVSGAGGLRAGVLRGQPLDIGCYHADSNRNRLSIEFFLQIDSASLTEALSKGPVMLCQRISATDGRTENIFSVSVHTNGKLLIHVRNTKLETGFDFQAVLAEDNGLDSFQHICFTLDSSMAHFKLSNGMVTPSGDAVTVGLFVNEISVYKQTVPLEEIAESALEQTSLLFMPAVSAPYRLTEVRVFAAIRTLVELESQKSSYLGLAAKRVRLQLQLKNTKKLFNAYKPVVLGASDEHAAIVLGVVEQGEPTAATPAPAVDVTASTGAVVSAPKGLLAPKIAVQPAAAPVEGEVLNAKQRRLLALKAKEAGAKPAPAVAVVAPVAQVAADSVGFAADFDAFPADTTAAAAAPVASAAVTAAVVAEAPATLPAPVVAPAVAVAPRMPPPIPEHTASMKLSAAPVPSTHTGMFHTLYTLSPADSEYLIQQVTTATLARSRYLQVPGVVLTTTTANAPDQQPLTLSVPVGCCPVGSTHSTSKWPMAVVDKALLVYDLCPLVQGGQPALTGTLPIGSMPLTFLHFLSPDLMLFITHTDGYTWKTTPQNNAPVKPIKILQRMDGAWEQRKVINATVQQAAGWTALTTCSRTGEEWVVSLHHAKTSTAVAFSAHAVAFHTNPEVSLLFPGDGKMLLVTVDLKDLLEYGKTAGKEVQSAEMLQAGCAAKVVSIDTAPSASHQLCVVADKSFILTDHSLVLVGYGSKALQDLLGMDGKVLQAVVDTVSSPANPSLLCLVSCQGVVSVGRLLLKDVAAAIKADHKTKV